MKVLFIVFISIILSAFNIDSYGQSKDAIIRDIKYSFEKINNDKSLKIVKLQNEEFMDQMTDNGGSLTGYFKGNSICKIHLWIGLSFGIRQWDFYLKNGELFFIYETEEDFPYDNKKKQLDYTKADIAFEGRYYLDKGKVISTIIKGKKRFGGQPDTSTKDVVLYTKLLLAHLKK